jgi:hypothetical protein
MGRRWVVASAPAISSAWSPCRESSSTPGPSGTSGHGRMPAVNGVGEPCAGEPHARFEAAGAGTGADLAKVTEVAQPTGKPAEDRPQALPSASHRASPRPYMDRFQRAITSRPKRQSPARCIRFGLQAVCVLLESWHGCRREPGHAGQRRRHRGVGPGLRSGPPKRSTPMRSASSWCAMTTVPGIRWVQVAPPGGGTQATPATSFDAMPVGSPRRLVPAVDDLEAEYQRIRSLGADFEQAPVRQPWAYRSRASRPGR